MTTKLYPRIVTSAVYVGLALLAILARPVVAEETPAIHFDGPATVAGQTLTLPDGAKAGILPNALPGEADVTWTVSQAAIPPMPVNQFVLGKVYRLTITGVPYFSPLAPMPLTITLPMGKSYWQHQIWTYNTSLGKWAPMITSTNSSAGLFTVHPIALDGLYAVLEDHTKEVGLASWYCKLHCSSRYPKLHGTSNDFPVGSYVTVTSTETNRSVTVKIVSRWGQPVGRIIDLSNAAYATLKTKNVGVTSVVVSPAILPKATAPTSSVKSESIPSLKLTQTSTTPAPTVSAASYIVYDQTTNTVLASSNSQNVAPIASLTKLMTAMVVVDSGVPTSKVMTYSRADVTSYAYLRVAIGDKLTVKDLFYSMIVGSANNAATALARSTGLTTAQFVAKMNAKAAAWGLTNTHFVDVNGLDPGNVSSANDLAIIAGHAFHDYPLIKSATLAKSYTFTTINTNKKHTILSTDKLLLAGITGINITGGKTGYLDEAKYTYVLRTSNAQGAQVVTVVLGSPTSASRFQSASTLAQWAWQTYQWS